MCDGMRCADCASLEGCLKAQNPLRDAECHTVGIVSIQRGMVCQAAGSRSNRLALLQPGLQRRWQLGLQVYLLLAGWVRELQPPGVQKHARQTGLL